MPDRAPDPNPGSLAAVWRAVRELEKDFKKLQSAFGEPPAWRKALSRFWKERNWSIPTLLVIFSAVCAGAYGLAGLFIDQHMRASMGSLQSDIQYIKGELTGIQLKRVSTDPADPQSIKDTQNVLQVAQSNKVSLSTDAIADAGRKFVSATKNNPDAWDAVSALLNYRSFLNAPHSPDIHIHFVPAPRGTQLTALANIHGEGSLTFQMSWPNELVPINQAFIYQPIGATPPSLPGNPAQTQGHSYILVRGSTGPGKIILDGMHLKNVILRDLRISYSGGPIVLENVYFVNCTFEIDRQSHGQELVNRILSGPATTFIVA